MTEGESVCVCACVGGESFRTSIPCLIPWVLRADPACAARARLHLESFCCHVVWPWAACPWSFSLGEQFWWMGYLSVCPRAPRTWLEAPEAFGSPLPGPPDGNSHQMRLPQSRGGFDSWTVWSVLSVSGPGLWAHLIKTSRGCLSQPCTPHWGSMGRLMCGLLACLLCLWIQRETLLISGLLWNACCRETWLKVHSFPEAEFIVVAKHSGEIPVQHVLPHRQCLGRAIPYSGKTSGSSEFSAINNAGQWPFSVVLVQ